jgi:hypothetical protein
MVTILGGEAGSARQTLAADIRDFSGSGLGLYCSVGLPVGAVIRINSTDSILLGEVCYCVPSEAGGFDAGVQLEHALSNLDQLEALRVRLLGAEAERDKHRAA